MADDLKIKNPHPSLHNADLAPVPKSKRNWGWFEIFNVWANDVQSLFGYTLAAGLFLSYGLNGWSVFAAIVLAGFFIMFLVNLSGAPCVRYGIPYPVFARVSMGVRGANLPAMLRAIVAIFWYGAQTYFASTAIALLLTALFGDGGSATFLGLNSIGWIAFLFVWAFQIYLFWNGMEWIRKFLNFAGPAVYVVMIVLLVILWSKAGGALLTEVGSIFEGTGRYEGSAFTAFLTVFGIMVAYFAAVVINFGDFSRFVTDEKQMKLGNLLGLPVNVAFFSLLALLVTGGTVVVFGEQLTNPTDIVARVDNIFLVIVAAFAFFAATIGINLVANFVPPAYDLANLMPEKINFKMGGLITSFAALIIGGLWVSVISQIGIFGFVNTLGAVLAPIYGIMVADFYLVKKQKLDLQALFSADKDAAYHYCKGWNHRAVAVFAITAIFSVTSVWLPQLSFLSGYAWIIGAMLGGVLYYIFAPKAA